MDLDEYALSESQRRLKRLGISHVWASGLPLAEDAPPAPEAPTPQAARTSETAARRTPNAEKPVKPDATSRKAAAAAAVPAVLRSLFHGKQSPVSTLWTYDGMFADLQQHTLPGRLDMFRKIQDAVCDHLGWKKNDICAWPLDLDAEEFRQGLLHFKPRTIICYGRIPAAMGAEMFQGIEIVMLPDLVEMAKGDKDLKNEAWKRLRALSA